MVLNGQDFAIFKTPRLFEFGQFLIANVHDLWLFCRFLSSTQGYKKWFTTFKDTDKIQSLKQKNNINASYYPNY